jgi:hypothetical protein
MGVGYLFLAISLLAKFLLGTQFALIRWLSFIPSIGFFFFALSVVLAAVLGVDSVWR